MGKVIPFAPKRPAPDLKKDLDDLAELQKRFSSGLDENDKPLDGHAVVRTFVDFTNLQKKIREKHKLSPQDIHRALQERGALPKSDPSPARDLPAPNDDDPDPGPQVA